MLHRDITKHHVFTGSACYNWTRAKFSTAVLKLCAQLSVLNQRLSIKSHFTLIFFICSRKNLGNSKKQFPVITSIFQVKRKRRVYRETCDI